MGSTAILKEGPRIVALRSIHRLMFRAIFIAIIISHFLCLAVDNSISTCGLDETVSFPLRSILCSVENGDWTILSSASAIQNAGCLLGANRCSAVAKIPTQSQIPPSPPPPDALNKDYQRLATIAEKAVPKTWWRDGFDNDILLLSHNDSELPRKQFNIRQLSNKKLRNFYQCVSRQVFIRITMDFEAQTRQNVVEAQSGSVQAKCTSMNDIVVKSFQKLWHAHKADLGGKFSDEVGDTGISQHAWLPVPELGERLHIAALEVLQHFYATHGGIWTGCFKLDKYPECRGALAAAAQVASAHFLADIAGRHRTFSESQFVRGYLLASLGRGLLHGDTTSVGDKYITSWGVKISDFAALQAAYLKLYISSFGALYKHQLNQYIPLAFPPTFVPKTKMRWQEYAQQLEPVYTSIRNWMFTESQTLIDFSPYRPLVAFQQVRTQLLSEKCRRVLVDVGANGFFASPKYLLDSYSIYLPFTHAIMIEPVPHFSATVPQAYKDRYNISHWEIYAEVNTGSDMDMVKLLPKMVTKEDFVVLKFDVDPNRYAYGPTMEWGFLFSLMDHPEVAALVDELYIELHFHMPSLYWKHYHSNWEALDLIRYLRNQGVIVHAWP